MNEGGPNGGQSRRSTGLRYAPIPETMVELRTDVHVRFVGPASDVLKWPMPGEQGVVQRVGKDATHVVWEHSPLVLAWPNEWIEPFDPDER